MQDKEIEDLTNLLHIQGAKISRIENMIMNIYTMVCSFVDEQEETMHEDSISMRAMLENIMQTIKCLESSMNNFSKLVNPNQVVEIYEKHINKIETMLLEFKGAIAMSRASLFKKA